MMNNTKKNLTQANKNVSSHNKKIKRSKSSDQLTSKKASKKMDDFSKT